MNLTTWIISYYKLDENSWTTAFDSAGSNDWTINGATWTTGKINSWLEFINTNDEVNLWPVLSIWTWDFSISFWLKTKTVSWTDNNMYIYNKRGLVGANRFFVRNNGWNLNFWTVDDGLRTSFWTFELSSNTEYYVVVTRSWTTGKIYVNWSLVDTWITKWWNLWWATNWQIWNLYESTNRFPANAMIDEAWIWNRALTNTEITELYNNWNWLQYWQPWFTPPPPSETLLNWIQAYYKFDEWSWTTAFDSVGSNDWTLSNTRIWEASWKINWMADFTKWNDDIALWSFWTLFNWSNSFAISWWFNTASFPINTNPSNSPTLLSFRQNNNIFIVHWDNAPTNQLNVIANINNVFGNPVSSPALSLNTWYHFVINYNPSSWWQMFLDGVLESTSSLTWTIPAPSSSNINYFGQIGGNARYYNWRLDEWWIWNRILTQAEVTELYNNWDWLQYPFWTQKPAWFLMRNF